MNITVNIHEAKTHLSRLVDQAAKGREFVIAKAGKPMVRVIPIAAVPTSRALGFLVGRGTIAADVKTAFAGEMAEMFGAGR